MQSYVFWRLCEQIKNGVELKENGSLQFHRKSAYTVCAWEKCEWVCVNKQFEMFEMSGSFCARVFITMHKRILVNLGLQWADNERIKSKC